MSFFSYHVTYHLLARVFELYTEVVKVVKKGTQVEVEVATKKSTQVRVEVRLPSAT